MTFRATLSQMWFNIQHTLFPELENWIGDLSPEYKNLSAILELIRIEDYIPCTRFNLGRPPRDRARIARAFIAKAVLKIPSTKQLLDRLSRDRQLRAICGWETFSRIPAEATISRVFAEFSHIKLPDRVHQLLISQIYQGKVIGHVVKDSTALAVRERAIKKEGSPKQRKKLMNERYLKEKKGELLSRRQTQLKHQNLEEMIRELPISCDLGLKKNSQGYATLWKGYKLHLAVDDNCVPLSAILTSASLNDSEAAIPLGTKTSKLVQNFYDLMDSAYDVSEVREHSISLGHVPIIDRHARSRAEKQEKATEAKRRRILNVCSAEERRYKERFPKERVNALYKDWYGGRQIYYRGHAKVFCHSMFGILALTASTLLTFVH